MDRVELLRQIRAQIVALIGINNLVLFIGFKFPALAGMSERIFNENTEILAKLVDLADSLHVTAHVVVEEGLLSCQAGM
jgi:hypothetical protein